MIDLSEAPVVDFHAHMPVPIGIGELIRRDITAQMNLFHGKPTSSYRWDDLEALPDLTVARQQWAHPLNSQYRMLIRYVADVLGCATDIDDVDARLLALVGGEFESYLASVLDRERIELVVLDLLGELRDGAAGFPDHRYVWIYGITPLLSPLAAIEAGAHSFDEAIAYVDSRIDLAVAQGCVGFKNLMGYYRSLEVVPRTAVEAGNAFEAITKAEPAEVVSSFLFGRRAVYGNAADEAHRAYEDFVIHHIVDLAGELGMVQLIHTGSQYSPNQNLLATDPALLFPLLSHPNSTRTTFVLLHAGAPFHENAAYVAWQFPNVFVDISHTMRTPGRLGGILHTMLSIAPVHKLLYGSDSYACAEWLGYSAHQTRKVLEGVLADLSGPLDWSLDEAEQVGRLVLGGNAKTLLSSQDR